MVILPFSLNFLILRPAPFPVIGNSNAPSIWLQFWGSYISAIGTICMAYLAYVAIMKDIRIHHFDVAKNDYDILEQRICKYEKLHMFEQLSIISNLYLSKGYYDAKVALNDYQINLQTVGLELVQFNDHSNESYKKYGNILSVLNQLMYDSCSQLGILIDSCEKGIEKKTHIKVGDKSISLEENILLTGDKKEQIIEQFIKEAFTSYSKRLKGDKTLYQQLASLGQELLKNKYNSIKKDV